MASDLENTLDMMYGQVEAWTDELETYCFNWLCEFERKCKLDFVQKTTCGKRVGGYMHSHEIVRETMHATKLWMLWETYQQVMDYTNHYDEFALVNDLHAFIGMLVDAIDDHSLLEECEYMFKEAVNNSLLCEE